MRIISKKLSPGLRRKPTRILDTVILFNKDKNVAQTFICVTFFLEQATGVAPLADAPR